MPFVCKNNIKNLRDVPIGSLPKVLAKLNSMNSIYTIMGVNQTLQKELEESELWLGREKDESPYKRELRKRIELINWVLGNIKHPQSEICDLIATRMNVVLKINESDSIIESDKLHSELRILNWILYQVSSNDRNVLN